MNLVDLGRYSRARQGIPGEVPNRHADPKPRPATATMQRMDLSASEEGRAR